MTSLHSSWVQSLPNVLGQIVEGGILHTDDQCLPGNWGPVATVKPSLNHRPTAVLHPPLIPLDRLHLVEVKIERHGNALPPRLDQIQDPYRLPIVASEFLKLLEGWLVTWTGSVLGSVHE